MTRHRFLVCVHDATPAFARETRLMLRDLGPLVGRRMALGVVPNWHRAWPLAAHPEYCRLVQDAAEEILLHGYFHQRQRGSGPTSLLAEHSDEMNGMTAEATRQLLERGQDVFTQVFGEPARGFLAPAWQRGHVRSALVAALDLEHVVGFFSAATAAGRNVRLATSTWDCGRWRWLAHIGHGLGWLRQSMGCGVPTLAVHPRDLDRGFWPTILRVTRELLDNGYEPATSAELLGVIPSEEARLSFRAEARSAEVEESQSSRKRALYREDSDSSTRCARSE